MAPETEDVHAAYAQLRERGVIVAHEVKEEFWGTLSTFSDPDGHGFILSQRQAT